VAASSSFWFSAFRPIRRGDFGRPRVLHGDSNGRGGQEDDDSGASWTAGPLISPGITKASQTSLELVANMPSAVTCASVALAVMLLTAVTNSLRPVERRSLPLEQLLLLSGVALLNLLLCILYSWWNRPKPAATPRVLVVGCGAVGSVVGFHLARGGAHVAFLVREDRADELDGLRLERLGLCACSEGSAAMIKQVEWVGFDVLTNVPDCCGPVRLRSDSPNQEPKPFDAVIIAVSAASSRAAAPALKQLVHGLERSCAVVRVVSELGEDRFFHNTLSVHHSALLDLGIGFMSYPQPLEGRGRAKVGKTFAYATTAPMLLSSSSSSSGGNATAHPMLTRLADCFNNGELPCHCVSSVGATLAVSSAALLGLVINLEYAGWKFGALRDDVVRRDLLSQSLGEALDIALSDTEGHRRSHAQRCCRCRARLLRAMLTSSCILRLVLWFATCTHCSFLTRNLLFPFDIELFLSQHFSKPGVGAQTRVFLEAYIAAAQERKLAVGALRTIASALPRLPAPRGSTG
jgi:hypothetical protein